MSNNPAILRPIITGTTVSEPDYYNTGENSTLIVTAPYGLLANDFTNLGTITATNFSEPENGTLVVGEDGSFTYTPDAGFTGIDTFTYYTTDGFTGGTASATVIIDVTHPAPVATADVFTVAANHTLVEDAANGLLANDLSLSGTTLTATQFSSPAHGTLGVSIDGSITYTPDAGYVGLDTFTYYISDGTATSSAVATIDVTDAAPIANPDNYVMRAGQTLVLDAADGLLANDSSDNGTLIATQFSSPAHGTLGVSLDGSITYTADPGYIGLDTFTYYISDGALTSSAVATIDVVDTAPVANSDHYNVAEDGTLVVSATHGLLANDFDPNGDSITATQFSSPAHGTLNVSLDGSITYTPDAGYVGADTFTYFISDGALTSSAVATITTEPLTPATLVAINPDTYAMGEDGTLVVGAAAGLLANDYANHGSISATSFSEPEHGTLGVSIDGSITYTPDAGYVGTDSFTYFAADGTVTGSAVVSIDVTHPAPVATADVFTVAANHTLVEDAANGLLANDLSLSGTTLTATQFSSPAHGTLGVSIDGSITYTPDAGYVGLDTFTYYISDGTATSSAVATIDVTDAAPIANPDNYVMRAGQTLVLDAADGLLANDSSDNGTLIATQFSSPAHGTLGVSLDGSITYTADPGYVGLDTFTYYISDGALTSSAVATIDVEDNAPVADPDYYHMTENGTLNVGAAHGLLANDFDPNGDSITATQFSSPAHGTLEVSLTGSFVYTPDAGYVGTDSFTYYISDGALTSSAVAEIDVVACYLAGTEIATPDGAIKVEELCIGDEVLTLHAGVQRIKWIGMRSYVAPFANNKKILPVCVKANAIEPGVPSRDLYVSPGHAICIDDALFHASRLVNGVSITQATRVNQITYYHIELAAHEILLAENCPAESFMDESFRRQFQNADEFYALYPSQSAAQTPCLPRHDRGMALHAMQRRLAARAGISESAEHGKLRGFIDQATPEHCFGWAQDEAAPERPVYLDIFAGEQRIGRVIANLFRADVRKAGFGNGYQGFEFSPPTNAGGPITIRRAVDGTILPSTGMSARKTGQPKQDIAGPARRHRTG